MVQNSHSGEVLFFSLDFLAINLYTKHLGTKSRCH